MFPRDDPGYQILKGQQEDSIESDDVTITSTVPVLEDGIRLHNWYRIAADS